MVTTTTLIFRCLGRFLPRLEGGPSSVSPTFGMCSGPSPSDVCLSLDLSYKLDHLLGRFTRHRPAPPPDRPKGTLAHESKLGGGREGAGWIDLTWKCSRRDQPFPENGFDIMNNRQTGASMFGIGLGVLAMVLVVTVSNVAVQFPINDWLTYGALTYPIAFLVTDLTNRGLGASAARRVVYVGFAAAVGLSIWLATPRIALASGAAFLMAQLLDIAVFSRLRRATWWRAPLISSTLASALDTVLFFTLAFAGTGLPWMTWAVGDYGVKIAVALALLIPFRLALKTVTPAGDATRPA